MIPSIKETAKKKRQLMKQVINEYDRKKKPSTKVYDKKKKTLICLKLIRTNVRIGL